MAENENLGPEAPHPSILEVAGTPHAAVPPGFKLEDLGAYLPRPVRDSRTFRVVDGASFMKYIELHRTERASIVANNVWPAQQILATGIMDDGDSETTSWRDHTCNLSPMLSPAFADWMKICKEGVGQLDLCLFLDRHLSDIVRPDDDKTAPSSSEVMQFVSSLEDVKKVEFKKSVNVTNGRVQLTYNEADDGAAGQITIPRRFFIRIRPVVGLDQTFDLCITMRYRITDATRLTFFLEIRELDRFLEALRAEILANVRRAADGLGIPLYMS